MVKESEGLRIAHISGACYQLRSVGACLSMIIDEWGLAGQPPGGFQGLDRLNRCTGVAVRCEEGSSWQTAVHGQSVRGCNDEASSMSV